MQLLEAQHCVWRCTDRFRNTASTWQRGNTWCQRRTVITQNCPEMRWVIVCLTGAEELATVLSGRVLFSVVCFLQIRCVESRFRAGCLRSRTPISLDLKLLRLYIDLTRSIGLCTLVPRTSSAESRRDRSLFSRRLSLDDQGRIKTAADPTHLSADRLVLVALSMLAAIKTASFASPTFDMSLPTRQTCGSNISKSRNHVPHWGYIPSSSRS